MASSKHNSVTSDSPSPTLSNAEAPDSPPSFRPTTAFWLVFLALCVSCFLSALDLTSVSTALPTIAADLKSQEYSWVGSAYALTSTALVPFTGSLAAIFGRRVTMLGSLVFFVVGSAISGAAPSMNVLILGRSIQGVGGGGILVMTDIIVCDLVPLASRGAFYGIIGSVWALASAIGPPIGGALASAGAWRWMFYLNLPISAIAIVFVLLFLNVKSPKTTLKEKIEQLDYANVIFIGGTTALILGLTFGGSTYPWASYQTLVPIILGITSIAVFFYIEKHWVKYPTVPYDMLNNVTSFVGFFSTFIHGLVVLTAIYYLPVYFQSTKGTSPIMSGINLFSLSFTIAPFAIFTGISVTVTGHYKTQNIFAWCLAMAGFGLVTLLKADSSKAAWVGFPVILGIGMGILYAGTNFPVLSPLRPEQHPQAMAFYAFVRSLGQVFGIAIGSTVLQNGLSKNLPEAFLHQIGGNAGNALAAIPSIKDLAEPLRHEVRVAFADSLKIVWQVMIGITAIGLLASLFMKQLSLTAETDEKWGLKVEEKGERQTALEKEGDVV